MSLVTFLCENAYRLFICLFHLPAECYFHFTFNSVNFNWVKTENTLHSAGQHIVTLWAHFITKVDLERFSGVQEASGVWRNAWTSICVIGSAAQPPPSPAVYSWDSLHITDTVNLLTPLRFLHFFAEKLRSSSESRSRRQCWILMILVPHGSTSKIYKVAGLAWGHNKWEEVITRGHFDTSDVTLLFRSTCTCVKAPLIQEPRLLSQTHTNTVTINYMQNYKTRTEVYLNADEHGLDCTRKDGKKHKTA